MSLCRSTPELLPCPACGNNERMKLSAVHSCGAQIVCDMCRLRGPFIRGGKYEDEEIDAAIAWNNLPRNTAQPPGEQSIDAKLMSLARIARTLEMIKESQVHNELPVSMKMVEEMAETARAAHTWKEMFELFRKQLLSQFDIASEKISMTTKENETIREELHIALVRIGRLRAMKKSYMEWNMSKRAELKDRLRAFEGHAIEDIVNERLRQVTKEGFSPEHDDSHIHSELACAAACYAIGSVAITYHGARIWPSGWVFKPDCERRNLVKAAALLVAEIERLDR